MTNSEKFLKAYGSIFEQLKQITGLDKSNSFYSFPDLIEKGLENDLLVKQFRKHLFAIGRLRNAIVHDGSLLAEPNDYAVRIIEQIEQEMTKPKLVIKLFKKKVEVCEYNNSLSSVLSHMIDLNISQMPVLKENEIVGLITTDTIARLAANKTAKDGLVDFASETAEEGLKFAENADNYKLFSRSERGIDAIEAFEIRAREGKRLDAILITHNGKKSESLLGIMSFWDLGRVYKELYHF